MVLSRCPRTHSGMAWVLLLAALLATALPAVSTAAPLPGDEIRLTVETPDYRLDDTGLRVPGYATHATPGAPALPVRVEHRVEHRADLGDQILALYVRLGLEQVHPHHCHRVGRIDQHHIVEPFLGNTSEEGLDQVTVGVEHCDAGAALDVLQCEIEEQRALAGAGLTRHVQMPEPFVVLNHHRRVMLADESPQPCALLSECGHRRRE